MTAHRPPAATKHPPDAEVEDDLSIHYPSSDGEPMAESDWQYFPLTDTVGALRDWFLDRPDVYVAGNMLVYYRINDNTTSVAPDVYAVFGAGGKHRRDSWLVWREGRPPSFVLEIASAGTWRRDAGEKRRIYAEMGVAEYWRFDPTGECFTPELIGERLAGGIYEPLPVSPDAAALWRGHSPLLGLDLCVLPGLELRLYDPAGGEWLLTYQENADARRADRAAIRSIETALQVSEESRQAAEDEIRSLREQLRAAQSGQ